jgi:very-short-patch-repair endonuclease
MLARRDAVHCRRHHVKTPEHQARIAAALKGKKRTPEQRSRLSAAMRGAGETDRRCAHCGSTFYVRKPSSKKRTCSIVCRYARVLGPPIPKLGVVRVRRGGRGQRTEGTNIERLMEAEFRRRHWPCEPQHCVGRVRPDFYLPDMHALVFCDGDYWHSKPEAKARDERITANLERNGYLVVRFKGSAIEASPARCAELVFDRFLCRTVSMSPSGYRESTRLPARWR